MNSNEYMREYMRKYSAARRQKALDILGGSCVRCGSVDELEIHHIDPLEKSFTLARGWHHAWEKIEEELKKCMILCDGCHVDHHRSQHPHGTVRRYWQKCRCDECRAANAAHSRKYKKSRK